MLRLMVSIILASILLIGCAANESTLKEQGLTPLTSAQMEELLTNNTSKGRNTKGTSWVVYNRADGTRVGTAKNSTDTGTWHTTKDGTMCSQWKTWRDGKEQCSRIYLVDGEYKYYDVDGTYGGSFKILEGNPNGL